MIEGDLVDSGDNARRVKSKRHQTDDDTQLITKHGPAEVNESVERDEAADADADQHEANCHWRPQPGLDGAQVSVVFVVEVFQTLDSLTHLIDAADICM